MDIVGKIDGDHYNAVLHGQFTFNDHMAFREVLQQIADSSVRQVTLHMAQVEFVDSAALGMLLLAHDESQKHDKKIILSGAQGQVKKMFEMARFHALFTMS